MSAPLLRLLGPLLLLAAAAACKSVVPAPSPPGEPGAYELRFEGHEHFTRRELEQQIFDNLVDFARSEYAEWPIDDAAYVIETNYRRDGFSRAEVEYEHRRAGEVVQVAFSVREGPRTVLEHVELTGIDTFVGRREELERFFRWEEEGLFGSSPRYYVAEELRAAIGSLVSWYRGQGFLAATAEAGEPAFSADESTATVTVRVQEGVRYRLEAVELEGELEYPPEEIEALHRDLLGEPYLPRTATSVRGPLVDFYRERGHADVEVDFERRRDDATGAVRLRFTVVPGPVVQITGVRYEGNDSTITSFLDNRLLIEEGDTYSASAVQGSFRRLYQTGLFESVQIELEGKGESRVLVVRLVEQPSVELYVEPGYGSYEGPRLELGAREKNVFGTGRILRSQVTGSPRTLRAAIGLTDPWILGTDTVADLSLSANRREEPSFEFEELGAGLFFSRNFTQHLSGTLGYQFRITRLLDSDVDDLDPLAQEILDDVDIASIVLIPEYDTRNALFVPTGGLLGRLRLEYADQSLGSEIDFFRTRVDHARYFELGEGTVLAASVRGAVIAPTGDTDEIPIQERLFNGGADTVRSFRESELGPQDDDGEPLGGEGFGVFSAELRQDLVGGLHGALFYDLGFVVEDYQDFLDPQDFGHGVGLGVRYLLPIGPVRLDTAWNPAPDDGEDDFVVHFSVGMAY